jgi:GT2 family glycosyltransferase
MLHIDEQQVETATLQPVTPSAPLRTSAIICAYSDDRWELLKDCVASLQQQAAPPHEIILVIDHNEQLAARAIEMFRGTRVMRNAEQRGLSGARNSGLRAATGDVVVFLDDDARAAPEWLASIASAFSDAGVVGVGTNVVPRWETGAPPWFPEEFSWVIGCSYRGLPREISRVRNPLGAAMAFRRDALERVGGFTRGIGRIGTLPLGCEETEASIRVRRQVGGNVLYLPDATVEHFIPVARTRWSYFVSRCWHEGISKGLIAAEVGRNDALASERTYVTTTLPKGISRGLKDALNGDPSGLARAIAIILGLVITISGYARARMAHTVSRVLRRRSSLR